jgi:hypothetical protein
MVSSDLRDPRLGLTEDQIRERADEIVARYVPGVRIDPKSLKRGPSLVGSSKRSSKTTSKSGTGGKALSAEEERMLGLED